MARVWFVRRRGGDWVAPGGLPACERPLADLIFSLDLGPHRRLSDEAPVAVSDVTPAAPQELSRVIVEATSEDVRQYPFSGYEQGYYDSPYTPSEAARRLRLAREEQAA